MIATTLHYDVLEIRMDNPPLNVMSRGLRIALLQALVEAQDNDAVKAIVLTGTGKAFTAGAVDSRGCDRPGLWARDCRRRQPGEL